MTEHQRWTQSDITDLRYRLSIGDAVADVAAALGRPVESVRIMMIRLRLREAAQLRSPVEPN